MADRLIVIFPRLANTRYWETSPATWNYNCIAWAACRNNQWWEPDPYLYFYWPPGVARAYTLQSYGDAYRSLGFEDCVTGDFDVRFRKIAIFVDAARTPMHAARQLESGRWTSKLGPDVDIEHESPEVLIGNEYGTPVLFMRRPRPMPRWPIALMRHGYELVRKTTVAALMRIRSML